MKRLLALTLLATLPAWGAVYKWVDDSGKVHYSDKPPPEGARSPGTVKVPKAAPAAPASEGSTPSAPKSAAEQEMEFRKRQADGAEAEAKRQKESQAAEEKKRNCQSAKARVAGLQAGGRITKYGPDGETIYLNDDDIARELAEARKIADSWCK